MVNNLKGLALSYIFVGVLFLLSKLLNQLGVKPEYNRKFLHIAIAHWWIIAMFHFDRTWVALIPPLTFILANKIAGDYHLLDAMDRKDSNNYGIIYYPISMALLVIFSFGIVKLPYVGAIGIFLLGYGDGLAALIGIKWGRRKIYRNKTLEGTLTMFFASFFVTFTILILYHESAFWITSLSVAIVATILEVFSPKGLDNITVPIISTLFYYFLFYL